MNSVITDQIGGFPVTLDKTLGFMQDNYTLLQEFGKGLCGTAPAILSGCVVTGGNVSAGVVIIAGEVLPFEGGPIGAKVAIEETVINKPYEDGVSRPAYKVRKAKFGAIGTNWSEFWRIGDLKPKLFSEIPAWNGTAYVYPGTFINNITLHSGFTAEPNEGGPLYRFTAKKVSNLVTIEGVIRVWVLTSTAHSSLMPVNNEPLGTMDIVFKNGFIPVPQDFITTVHVYTNKTRMGTARPIIGRLEGGVFKVSGIGGYGEWTGDEFSYPGQYYVELSILTSFYV